MSKNDKEIEFGVFGSFPFVPLFLVKDAIEL